MLVLNEIWHLQRFLGSLFGYSTFWNEINHFWKYGIHCFWPRHRDISLRIAPVYSLPNQPFRCLLANPAVLFRLFLLHFSYASKILLIWHEIYSPATKLLSGMQIVFLESRVVRSSGIRLRIPTGLLMTGAWYKPKRGLLSYAWEFDLALAIGKPTVSLVGMHRRIPKDWQFSVMTSSKLVEQCADAVNSQVGISEHRGNWATRRSLTVFCWMHTRRPLGDWRWVQMANAHHSR